MRFRSALTICVLYLLSMVLSGCHTVKGAVEGGVEGFSKDWETAKRADRWIRENLW